MLYSLTSEACRIYHESRLHLLVCVLEEGTGRFTKIRSHSADGSAYNAAFDGFRSLGVF